MPRLVVPSAFLPRNRSVRRSNSWWYGIIRCALPETMSRETSTFLALNESNSASRTAGSTTTPLPMTGVIVGYSTPEGTSCKAKASPLTTMR